MSAPPDRPLRLLVVCPSWVGDVAMATPVLRLLRDELPGAFIGGLVRPGCDELLAGTSFFDELHVERAAGVMGPKFVAAKIRPRRYDTALLLTNSFSTALITRIAGIPRRFGYDRDGRALLLTDKIKAHKQNGARGDWAVVPAVDYYWRIATHMLSRFDPARSEQHKLPADKFLELATTDDEETRANGILSTANVGDRPFVVLNPGGNNPAKRWPTDRFARLADELADTHAVLVNGSPNEADLVEEILARAESRPHSLPALGNSLGSLKAIAPTRLAHGHQRHRPASYRRRVRHAGRLALRPDRPPLDDRADPPGRRGDPASRRTPTCPSQSPRTTTPDRCRIENIGYQTVRDAALGLLNRA